MYVTMCVCASAWRSQYPQHLVFPLINVLNCLKHIAPSPYLIPMLKIVLLLFWDQCATYRKVATFDILNFMTSLLMYWGPPPDHMDQKVNLKLFNRTEEIIHRIGSQDIRNFFPKTKSNWRNLTVLLKWFTWWASLTGIWNVLFWKIKCSCGFPGYFPCEFDAI